jgi:hypothetical protein
LVFEPEMLEGLHNLQPAMSSSSSLGSIVLVATF